MKIVEIKEVPVKQALLEWRGKEFELQRYTGIILDEKRRFQADIDNEIHWVDILVNGAVLKFWRPVVESDYKGMSSASGFWEKAAAKSFSSYIIKVIE
jgi:hypothetical protein